MPPRTASSSSEHRLHRMPFGAEVQADGTTRFALWAPDARCVELCLETPADPHYLPLSAGESGWFELVTDLAGHGSRYRYRIDGMHHVPDPASRFQPEDIDGPSQVIDPRRRQWGDTAWRGRPWEEAVIYELHVGAFTAKGTFAAVEARLDHLVELGITAVELMPVADFPGQRNWGYDGVLPFAPDHCYGTPDTLKSLVEAAHGRGLMVVQDVVYNHFGPQGNYLHEYARAFFSRRHKTPWGPALNFDGVDSYWVRRFFIHNALYWLEEYGFDGLRLDAVEAIVDDSDPDLLCELAAAVRAGPGAQRRVHLVLENERNEARYLTRYAEGRPEHFTAQWNDDLHHALHVLLTAESQRYYQDYSERPRDHLARCLGEGFAYQGEPSRFRGGEPRGEPSAHLPPDAFVNFLQNHDQIGNRPGGERITSLAPRAAVEAALAVVLLAPSPPLLFMGQEWGSKRPFQFFCDFEPWLAEQVRRGRRQQFNADTPADGREPPDPGALITFQRSTLDWKELAKPSAAAWLRLHRTLLDLRRREIVPRLPAVRAPDSPVRLLDYCGLRVAWLLRDGARLTLLANLGAREVASWPRPAGERLFGTAVAGGKPIPPWSVAWYLDIPESGA